MESRKLSEAAPIPSSREPRPYHPPTLTAYGSVGKLTQGGQFSAVDGNMTMMIDSPGQEMMP